MGEGQAAVNDEAAHWNAALAKIASLEQAGRNGANWFFWVAGMSLINSVIMLFGGDTYFVIGLGVTLIVDFLANDAAREMPQNAHVFKGVAIAFDLLVALIVVGFGWLASKRYLSLYALGMVLYLLDGLLFVWLQDWLSAGFHAFALFCMWSGFSAFRQQRALLNQLPPDNPSLAVESTAATF